MKLGFPNVYTHHKLVVRQDINKLPPLPGVKDIRSTLKMVVEPDLNMAPKLGNEGFGVKKFMGKISDVFKHSIK